MNCQMMRVISSPSISTTGFLTLIFAILRSHLLSAGTSERRKFGARSVKTAPRSGGRVYATGFRAVKAPLACELRPHQEARGCRQDVRNQTPLIPRESGDPVLGKGPGPRFGGDEWVAASKRGERGVQRGARPHRGR